MKPGTQHAEADSNEKAFEGAALRADDLRILIAWAVKYGHVGSGKALRSLVNGFGL